MITTIIVAVLPFLVKLATWIFDTLIQNAEENKKMKELFAKLTEEFRKQGLANVQSRFETQEQVDAGNAKWDEIEAKKKSTP